MLKGSFAKNKTMSTNSISKKRVRVSRKPKSCPNPLFLKWLTEMKEDAVRRESRLQYVYSKAIKSLEKYPLILHSGRECKVLQHFGDGLCQQLDKKLQEYLNSGGKIQTASDEDSQSDSCPSPKRSHVDKRKSREYIPTRRSGAYALLLALLKHCNEQGFLKKKELLDLAQPYADVSFTQTDLLNSQYYNAWSAMAGLIKKGLVIKSGNPAKYELTDTGTDLAIRLELTEVEFTKSADSKRSEKKPSERKRNDPCDIASGSSYESVKRRVLAPPAILQEVPNAKYYGDEVVPLDNDVIQIEDDEFDRYSLANPLPVAEDKIQQSYDFAPPYVEQPPEVEEFLDVDHDDEELNADEDSSHERITLAPDEYDIFLCVDHAEVSGGGVGGTGRNQKEAAAKAFQNCGVPIDVRKLAIGDYLWICKPRSGSQKDKERELALPFVVERKRLDDLVSSMKDGRFKEQKFRLKHSGLCRPIYLIEEHGNRQNLGLPEASVLQAIANTLIVERFQIHWTRRSEESVEFLVEMTKKIINLYKDKTVTSRPCRKEPGNQWLTKLVPFKELYINSTKQKPLSVSSMFAKQLIQLHGLSVEKAQGIVSCYPTLGTLIEALQRAGPNQAALLLANVEYGKAKKKLGPALSALLARHYTKM